MTEPDDAHGQGDTHRKGSPDKFAGYVDLVEACARPGCPVCRCLGEATRQALDALLYEQVTDSETRGQLRRSAGFCAWHVGLAEAGQHAALGLAIIYEDLLRLARARLEEARRELAAAPTSGGWRRLLRRAPSSTLVRAWTGRAVCPLCAALAKTEAGYLRTVLDFLGSPEFDQAYAGSVGLCLPHVMLALAGSPGHRAAEPLLARALERLDALVEELGRFVDKHDYRNEAPFTVEEAASWASALRAVAGEPGPFGNEIPRSAGRREPPPGPASATRAEPSAAEGTGRRHLEALLREKERLEERLRELTQEFADDSGQVAALRYRLRIVEEDRKVLELNLSGERAAARLWESRARELEAEVEALRQRLGPHGSRAPGGGGGA